MRDATTPGLRVIRKRLHHKWNAIPKKILFLIQLMFSTAKKKVRLRSLLLSVTVFFLILLVLNFYQHSRVQSNVAATLLQGINQKELEELQQFFDNIDKTLNIVKDWGRNGVLEANDTVSLNKKLFPLLEHQERVSGVLLANNRGQEYFLRRSKKSWLTRRTSPGGKGKAKGNTAIYQEWQTAEKGSAATKKKTDYDPRQRPWFHRSAKNSNVFWTPMYTFFESREQGVTASVSWESADNPHDFFVFGIDIKLSGIQRSLRLKENNHSGMMFLVNPEEKMFFPGILNNKDKQGIESTSLMTTLIQKWNEKNQPDGEAIRFQYNKQQWLGSLQPLTRKKSPFWIGVTVPEQELLSHVHDSLFRVTLTDVLVATSGGLLLFFFLWKNGGFSSEAQTQDPVLRLHELINRGEGGETEFKSTVRTNLNSGKKGKEIELAWLKAVVAFLNTKGGFLLLGVADNGMICGLEMDKFENNDRCLLHIKNLINQHIGAEFSAFLDVALLEVDDKIVVLIEVTRAGQPVFLNIGKNEEFYIRSGPSSIKLSPSQMLSYVLQNKMERKKHAPLPTAK